MHNVPNRRSVIKAISAISLTSVALPKQWQTPLVDSIVIPAHAQTSITNTSPPTTSPPTTSPDNPPQITIQGCGLDAGDHYYVIDFEPRQLPFPDANNIIDATFEIIDFGQLDPRPPNSAMLTGDNEAILLRINGNGLLVGFSSGTHPYIISYLAPCGGQGSDSETVALSAIAYNPNGGPIGFYMVGYDIFWSTDQDGITTYNLDNFSLFFDPTVIP